MILFLAGTSDARTLAVELQKKGYNLLATVVTNSAAISLEEAQVPYYVGRLTKSDMLAMILDKKITTVIDASHPYAEEASKTAMEAANESALPYIRYERPQQEYVHPLVTEVDTYEEAALLASEHSGTVMLTTGSKTLATFTKYLLKDSIRLVCRMLPNKENMEKCDALGVKQRDIIAIQGPFSKELNTALYRQYETSLVITKESGKEGSVDEKIEAALELNIPVILIKRPKINYTNQCSTFEEVYEKLGGI
ncbi:precorrin-6x reductase [Ureibacillus massiliensis 4400831 = CIP 108448 = CCUG 49529]|uniref:Precorrin-6x reductase n=1 Tax=Ureibacillus massiliensis 4400831 = CIP 108448 = CCUG 49529 TaxID=1211035 RepID=A0A0A3J070_9BACL|nr:precorrin-6A reductase [Ureibacillus massiliensis]KGR89110.1 precorrin-6x reductase [Ureibacillus massiliensis 4400831 = CIP 108448 = CCUG 49529]